MRSRLCAVVVVLLLVTSLHCTPPPKRLLTGSLSSLHLAHSAAVVASADELARLSVASLPKGNWTPAVKPLPKSPIGAGLFERVAPATVVVRVPGGHGSGFVVDPAGWIVTNQHVIDEAGTDAKTGAPVAMVYFGRYEGGMMRLLEDGVPALVYAESEQKDLALLKLSRKPEGVGTLSTVPLMNANPLPGTACAAIGHPAAGLLWTVRSCHVAGVGTWPDQMIQVVMQRLAESPADRVQLEELIHSAPKRKVLLSDCGINPGDSGGPLVNDEGRLIAVTFAIPLPDPQSGTHLDKFSYHVHVDEVRSFIAEKPASPGPKVYDAWPPALYGDLLDRDEDGKRETLLLGQERDEVPLGVLLDLDQNSRADLTPEDLANPDRRAGWDYEFAIRFGAQVRVFYDTDDDNSIDVILSDEDRDGAVDRSIAHDGDRWEVRDPSEYRALLDATLLPHSMRAKFEQLLSRQQ